MKKLYTILCVICLCSEVIAQDCNCIESTTDLTITSGQTVVVNAYYPGSANALKGSKSITLGAKRTIPGAFTDSGGTIASGDLVMIIQMQGAEIDPTIPDMETEFAPGADNFNSTDYGDGPGGLDHEGFLNNGSYTAGQYEFAIASSDVGAGGGTLTLQNALNNSYISNATPSGNMGIQTFQVIKVGNYNDLTIDVGGEITTVPWNGSTGGIITLDALGEMTLNGTIDADFAGFRGGLLDPSSGDHSDPDPGWRGEGIAGRPDQVYGYNDDLTSLTTTSGLGAGYPGGTATSEVDVEYGGTLFNNLQITFTNSAGPGAPGNGGGAGLINNGGGGGSNGGGGGAGATSGDGSGGDFLIPAGGGQVLSLDQGDRLFLGGGGGSGGQTDVLNDAFPIDVVSGHPGGGAVLIRADTLLGSGTISVNGHSGGSFAATAPDNPDEDGAGGGGGAGGTIILVTSSEDISGINFNAIGGDGSSLTGDQMYASPDGGGGGGSGGNVTLVRRGGAFSPVPTNIDVTGGAAGGTQGTPSANSEGGDGATELLTTPPSPNLDCPLITLPAPAPGGVSGSIIWFNPGQEVTYNGSNQITSWGDYSASGFNMTNSSVSGISGTTPDFVGGSFTEAEGTSNPDFNFNSSISFNQGASQDDYLAFSNFNNINGSEITVFTVPLLEAASPNDQTFFSYLPNDDVDDEFDIGVSNDGGGDTPTTGILDNGVYGTGDIRDGETRIVSADYNNTNANIWVNNGTATTTALSAGTLDTGGTLVFGQDLDDFATPAFDNTRELQGQLGDVIIFNRILSATERQQVSSFLAIKYGITLDQSTNQDYLNSIGESIYPALTNASFTPYDNDIVGVGRDDGSGLTQLRSKSINDDAIMTLSQTDGFAIDRQFVIIGNNDAGFAFNTTEISAGITDRIQREWKVDVSNDPDPIDYTFDLSGTTSTPLSSEIVAMVVDDDGDFSNGFLRTISANSWDGSTATFQNVSLNDGEVFTIAEVPPSPGGAQNVELWLKANVGLSTTGSAVTAWADQSGNANNATSVNNPTVIADGLNFNNVVDFDGTNDNMDGAAGFYTQEYFIVAQPDVAVNGTANGFVMGFEDGASTFSGFLLGTNTDGYVPDDRIVHIVGANGDGDEYRSGRPDGTFSAANEPVVFSSYNNVGATVQEISHNGTDINPVQYANALKNLSNEQYKLGNNYTLSNYYDGGIAEVISFSVRLSDTQRAIVQSYLAIKYGITLDGNEADYLASDGDFIYETVVAPGDYNNDIAGIVRDDISAFSQPKSQSENGDAIVTIALTDNGGSFASPNTFTANLSSLAWGNDNDDNGIIEDVTTEIPANTVTRLDREWRVQEKGTVGNVTLEIDISGVTANGGGDFTGRSVEDFLLLIDDGGQFDNGITRSIEATSYNSGTEVVTFVVDFDDGDIFTLATSRPQPGPGGVSTCLDIWLLTGEGTSTTTDGNEVDTWTDQSSNAYSFADNVLTATNGPTYRDAIIEFNNNPYLEFNSGAQTAENLSAAITTFPTTDYTMFNVFRSSSLLDNHLISYTSGGTQELNIHDPDNIALENQGTNNATGLNAGDGTVHVLTNYLDNQVANDPTSAFVDGTAAGGNPINSGATGNFSASGTLSIGQEVLSATFGTTQAGSQFIGDIGETVLFNCQLSASEITRVESYLGIKYGITMNGGDYDYISSNGTIVFPGNSDATFSSHQNDVGIIGRDDNTNLMQQTSKSINNNAVLSVTKNEPFEADDQFFGWADNGDPIGTSSASDFPSGIEGRLDRTWKATAINNPTGTVDMTFDLTGVTVNMASDLRILVDTDGDGDFSNANVITIVPSQNGNAYTFAGIDITEFPDGALFTISTIDQANSPLPLDWLSFDLFEKNGEVRIEWSTTNEVDVSHFDVERSPNGIEFEAIARVDARNSNGIHEYGFTDLNPLSSVNYYRVKQVDFDGSSDYTRIKFVLVGDSQWRIEVYPNPVTDIINVESSVQTSGRIRLLDLNGRSILDYPYSESDRSIDLSGIENGIYILEIRTILGIQIRRILKK